MIANVMKNSVNDTAYGQGERRAGGCHAVA